MLEESQVVDAPVLTQDKTDHIEVETNIEPTPENGVEDKGSKKAASEPLKETPEQTEQRAKKTRNEKKRAEKERLISELATEREKNRQLAEKTQSKEPAKQERKVDLSKKPDITHYSTDQYLDYVEDLAKFNANELLLERDKKTAAVERDNQIANFQEQAAEIRNEIPDFDEKMQKLYDAGLVSAPIENAVLKSSMSGKLTEHFVKFPGDLKQLNDYRPELVPQAIKAIENFIKAGGKQEEKPRITQAKTPIKPPGNNAKTDRSVTSYTQEEIENMPLNEYRTLFMKN